LDRDDGFRARVSEAVGESEVGRASWLYLARPDGWESELEGLVMEAAHRDDARIAARADSDVLRRAEVAESALRRLTVTQSNTKAEVDTLGEQLAEAQRKRRQLQSEAAAALKGRQAIQDRLDATKAEYAKLQSATAASRLETAKLAQTLASTRAELHQTRAEADAARSEADATSALLAELTSRLEQSRRGLEQLLSLLDPFGRQAGALAVGEGPPAVGRSGAPSVRPSIATDPESLPRAPLRQPARVRTPLALPPGIFDDSVEAARHLLWQPELVVLLDGYNVSQEGWPRETAAEQRQRTMDLVNELVARTSAHFEVVFDGASDALGTAPTHGAARNIGGRRRLSISFSPPGVEADEVIVSRLGRLDNRTPAIVVSTDNEVRRRATRAGANVVGSRQFLLAARRRGPGSTP